MEILEAALRRRQPELEALFRTVLLDLLDLPDEQRLWWADLNLMLAALLPVEAEACARAVEALWLDRSLEEGFSSDGELGDP
ncbi:MAG: hypothetical protein CMF57_12700 [Leifsonia sp.]|nr:hypothetical protein [Leifsonia sp.]